MSYLRDFAFCIGAGLVLFGLWQWSAPLAYVAGGVFVAFIAAAWSWLSRKESP